MKITQDIIDKLNLKPSTKQAGSSFVMNCVAYEYKDDIFISEFDPTGTPTEKCYGVFMLGNPPKYMTATKEFLLDVDESIIRAALLTK